MEKVRKITSILKSIAESYPAEKSYEIIREFSDIAIEMLKVKTQRFLRAENRSMEFIKNKK